MFIFRRSRIEAESQSNRNNCNSRFTCPCNNYLHQDVLRSDVFVGYLVRQLVGGFVRSFTYRHFGGRQRRLEIEQSWSRAGSIHGLDWVKDDGPPHPIRVY